MQRVMMESGSRRYCLKIKVNAEFLSLDLLFIFSFKKKVFRNSKISDILREYQHESSLERFYGHFDSKGCFFAQILPSSLTGLPIKLSCDCRNLAVNSLKFLFS